MIISPIEHELEVYRAELVATLLPEIAIFETSLENIHLALDYRLVKLVVPFTILYDRRLLEHSLQHLLDFAGVVRLPTSEDGSTIHSSEHV